MKKVFFALCLFISMIIFASIVYADYSPASTTPRVIDPTRPMVALTFDDGPAARNTAQILDVLEAHQSSATFFVVGNRIRYHEPLVRRMHDNGFEVVGHSWNHANMTRLTDYEIRSQILIPHNTIEKTVGGAVPFIFRAPYGAVNAAVRVMSQELGFALIDWSVDPRDWEARNAQTVAYRVLRDVRDGDIVLLHDLHASTAAATELIVPELVTRGYQLVSVSELFYYRGIEPQAGNVYFHASPHGVYVNGARLRTEIPPLRINGRFMIQSTHLANAMNARHHWNANTQTITMIHRCRVLIMQINNPEARLFANGADTIYDLGAAPMMRRGSTLIPIRALELLGATVQWQNPDVIITTTW
ncbi:MAG: polysaccharide deacetylase family protein [Defluviitaleaceae bacterium]|nr:polysaccharide deacetylase family protein [Defluviitaleaceae bacterium]